MRTEGLLKQSQELAAELQAQQKELQQTNEELGQKAQLLAAQNAEVERKNQEIEQARRALEEKAAELALTSRYKSEFLANMSHELRTPLNSILILGQQLADNADGNLSPKQVEFAKTIHGAGTDLLNLISDILDLSKIESGTVTVETEDLPFAGAARDDRAQLPPRGRVAQARVLERARPAARTRDHDRLEAAAAGAQEPALERLQVHRRTAACGSRSRPPTAAGAPTTRCSARPGPWSRFSVTDTGIGIPPEKQKIIFEAFQQADAGTSRKYGGTGLGLAISRELAHLLGGEIRLHSVPGRGSTFTLYLPLALHRARPTAKRAARPQVEARAPFQPIVLPAPRAEEVADDREALAARRRGAADRRGRSALRARAARASRATRGFKALVAMRGADALDLARKHLPTAISLDIFLPDMLGWTVLNQLKQDPATRHIPVQIITVEEERQHGLERGAFAYLNKPLTTEGLEAAFDRIKEFAAPRVRRLLVVEDNPAEQLSIVRADRATTTSRSPPPATGAEALEALREQRVRLRGARPAPARHVRLRPARARSRRTRRCARCRSSCSPARSSTDDEDADLRHDGEEHRAEGRAVARAAARRDRAVPAPRDRRPARRRSGACSSGCTRATRRSPGARCWWSTTTCATSSR